VWGLDTAEQEEGVGWVPVTSTEALHLSGTVLLSTDNDLETTAAIRLTGLLHH
jgi:hypothetical protein